jgi:hypothetical protein
MTTVLDFMDTMIKTTVITVGITLAAVAGFAVYTKPENKTLNKDIESHMMSNSNGPLERAAGKLISKVATKTSTTNIKDYVVVKTADVTFVDGSKQTYIGAFQNWFPIS